MNKRLVRQLEMERLIEATRHELAERIEPCCKGDFDLDLLSSFGSVTWTATCQMCGCVLGELEVPFPRRNEASVRY